MTENPPAGPVHVATRAFQTSSGRARLLRHRDGGVRCGAGQAGGGSELTLERPAGATVAPLPARPALDSMSNHIARAWTEPPSGMRTTGDGLMLARLERRRMVRPALHPHSGPSPQPTDAQRARGEELEANGVRVQGRCRAKPRWQAGSCLVDQVLRGRLTSAGPCSDSLAFAETPLKRHG